MKKALRAPRMAGNWYPGQSGALADLLERLRAEATTASLPRAPQGTRWAGLVVPHAGYRYSGRTAASAYATLATWRPARVVVVAPSHREAFAGVSAWSPVEGRPAAGAWGTPLGEVEIDLDFLERLTSACPIISCGGSGHGEEHSLELQLPFLQHALGAFRLVPLVMGDQHAATALALGRALADTLAREPDPLPTLLVASSDLSHFHGLSQAGRLDRRFLAFLAQGDEELLLAKLAAGSCEACGGGPVAAVLRCCNDLMPRLQIDVLDYRTSADENGDATAVVGYAAALIRESLDG